MRRSRVVRVARELGFVGRIEYRHVYSQTGGALYARGSSIPEDLLTVYAEAFERDADPEDFSLEAILAHERGHQIMARHPAIAPRLDEGMSIASEEILASLIGALSCQSSHDRQALMAKATVELINHGEDPRKAVARIQSLTELLKATL
jgi:hypothetical protein